MAGLPAFGSSISINSSGLGNALNDLINAADIEPGDMPSYEICKAIWLYHPLGKKLVEGPIVKAQSQTRTITIPDSPEEMVRDQFIKQWDADSADKVIYSLVSVSRAYGIGSLGIMIKGEDPDKPLDFKKLANKQVSFSVWDPLNTAGSLVLNQDPLSIDFMKVTGVAVSGKAFHRSRTVTLMHEQPVYISYTSSAYGFVGRSVFQRALFPLKSFIQTLITDDLVVKKAGVFIAMLKTAGAIIDKIMASVAGLKRLFVKEATNGNVISIGVDESIETLNMQNIDGAYGMARQNILENIATAADMPAIILKQETYAEGFGEGTEDAKMVADYIDSFRKHMKPAYDFMDPIIQRRAWNEDFYQTVQAKFPEEYAAMTYEQAFYKWQNSFRAEWPNLLKEPESEKIKVDDVKLKGIIAYVEVLAPQLDPVNKAALIQWAQDNLNENKMMFQTPLQLDFVALAEYVPPTPMDAPGENKPFAANDAAEAKRHRVKRAMDQWDAATGGLIALMEEGRQQRALPPPKRDARVNGHAAVN